MNLSQISGTIRFTSQGWLATDRDKRDSLSIRAAGFVFRAREDSADPSAEALHHTINRPCRGDRFLAIFVDFLSDHAPPPSLADPIPTILAGDHGDAP